ncbi:hypothetical protein EMPS_02682 [Entomortierella parvispora]|uniref:Uncharacterized protein n=1 Tax=Entomortierella parvispora TaxID=205924 RepID=A0A9P3H5X1_9FUNG|nr:hypothetical protein EMPS_02682 [Entomortierella parvispora]
MAPVPRPNASSSTTSPVNADSNDTAKNDPSRPVQQAEPETATATVPDRIILVLHFRIGKPLTQTRPRDSLPGPTALYYSWHVDGFDLLCRKIKQKVDTIQQDLDVEWERGAHPYLQRLHSSTAMSYSSLNSANCNSLLYTAWLKEFHRKSRKGEVVCNVYVYLRERKAKSTAGSTMEPTATAAPAPAPVAAAARSAPARLVSSRPARAPPTSDLGTVPWSEFVQRLGPVGSGIVYDTVEEGIAARQRMRLLGLLPPKPSQRQSEAADEERRAAYEEQQAARERKRVARELQQQAAREQHQAAREQHRAARAAREQQQQTAHEEQRAVEAPMRVTIAGAQIEVLINVNELRSLLGLPELPR